MQITGGWLDHPGTRAVCGMLTGAGHRALFVGGCVRDSLLDRPVGDIDIATDARPERVVALSRKAGIRAVPTGIDHGTVTLIAHDLAHEVTTFRADVETDGRHAVVRFSDDVATDAARRDFTMNALYATPEGEVVDPLGGLSDLRARRVRFVGDPAARIAEDHLRILRFFRFHAWYGDPAAGMDAEALAAIAAGSDGLSRLSRERIGAEMRKLLSAPDPAPAVAAMRSTGALMQLLPGADDRALAPLVHLEGDRPVSWIRRLAVLGGPGVADALRLSRAEAKALDTLIDGVGNGMSPGELGYRVGAEVAGDILLLRGALLKTPPTVRDFDLATKGARARFPVRPKDLMPRYKGAHLGERLRHLETRWIASGFALTRDQLCGEGDG
ncbi:poly(A) polymerase [Primorskyibacter flagellatus]|uniref:Poly(A) polymerase n=1 Tax=Primorskyibacter flagellatus TaxID=1387277 RepID=A0A917ADT3_9RHOB|nr:CCA tRNA nucleotidyltransferase [Primorskyibacter flagellatus]GGE45667.1 poly(A) polymerase [Primorskyibacter flagellatus]